MPNNTSHSSLGRLLVDRGLINVNQLGDALEKQKETGMSLGRTLIDLGFISEDDLMKALSSQVGMELIDLESIEPSKEAINKVSSSMVRLYNIMPIKYEKDTLTIAISDPLNVTLLDDLRFTLSCNIKATIAKEGAIKKVIEKFYQSKDESIGEVISEIEKKGVSSPVVVKEGAEGLDRESLEEIASQAPVVKLLNLVLLQAVKDRASDIHFEPFEDEFKVRFRIDGVCYEVAQPPKSLSLAVLSRIKVMANLDVAESRLPQDGRIMMSIGNKNVDLRVSTLPTVFGESVVMRVLDKSTVSLSLDEIGLADDTKKMLRTIIHRPNGIILSTGPTGSGKTTTLYSCLREINKIDAKVITTEDPVEYDVAGIIQVTIKPKIDLSFARCLRHILRQDPDIIMVGEIRDSETAQVAVQASLTGHLVFSTLHTNDAPGAITRLIDMGVEPFLITSTLEGVLAQRLVRAICPKCKESYKPNDKELKEFGLNPEDVKGKTFYQGKGCSECNKSGYKGRTGIYELLLVNDKLRALTIDKVQTAKLREVAEASGMRTLRQDGLLKIYEGITTISEVLRETQAYV